MEENYLELKQAMLLDLQSTHQCMSRRDRHVSDGRDWMLQRTVCKLYSNNTANFTGKTSPVSPSCTPKAIWMWWRVWACRGPGCLAPSVSAGLLKTPRDTGPTFPALGLFVFPFRDTCPNRYLPSNVHSNDGNQQSNLRCAWTSLDVSKSRLSMLMKPPSSQRVLLHPFKESHYTKCQLEDDNRLFQSQKLLL